MAPHPSDLSRMRGAASPPSARDAIGRGPAEGLYSAMLEGMIRDPQSGRLRATQYFVYSVLFDPLASDGTGTQDIAIQADSDFLCLKLNGSSRDPGAGNAADAELRFLFNIVTSGSGRQLFDRAQDAETILGSGQRPGWLPVPLILRRNGTVAITVQDLRSRDSDIRITLSGFKVFTGSMGG